MTLMHENTPKYEAQLLNGLKATGMEVGRLMKFGAQKVELMRLVLSNQSVFDPR